MSASLCFVIIPRLFLETDRPTLKRPHYSNNNILSRNLCNKLYKLLNTREVVCGTKQKPVTSCQRFVSRGVTKCHNTILRLPVGRAPVIAVYYGIRVDIIASR